MSISSPRLGPASGTARPHAPGEEGDADAEDRYGEHHAHGQPAAVEVADLHVRQAYELDGDAEERIADGEYAGDDAGPAQREKPVRRDADDKEQHEPFE